ncbi:Perchlorate reductase subunit gamma precursor [Planctomycetes bacterium K23_9]|uniref:Perchlorate reductase subunit gamma n=2 Tax=Stieleria marina TaxID=1930275 RepID=A0A517NVR4_9BACT|nr:Perchlorate reductase subunit gamma precursor [Planctomycetes bacterium K23_9]
MVDPGTDGMEKRASFFKSLRINQLLQLSPRSQTMRRMVGLSLCAAILPGCFESSPPPIVPIESELRIGLPTGGNDTGDLHAQTIRFPGDQSTPARTVGFRADRSHASDAIAEQDSASESGAGASGSPTNNHRFAFHSPMTVNGANARLAKREQTEPSRDRIEWGMQQLQSSLRPPVTTLRPADVTFVQITEPAPSQVPIEIIDPPAPDAVPPNAVPPKAVPPKAVPPKAVPPKAVPQTPSKIMKPELVPTPEGVPDTAKTPPAMNPDAPQLAPLQPATPAKTDPTKDKDAPMPGGLKSVTDEGTSAIPVELRPEAYSTWETPDVTLFVTGQQNGYIEPCGCTGLEKQKGGVARRLTFMNQLRDQGWDLLPIDAGNQVRRVGRQASIKISWSTEALKKMQYESVGFGPDDMRLPATDLLQLAFADSPEEAMYISANVVLYDESYVPIMKVVQRGKHRVGITNVLDPDALETGVTTEALIKPAIESAKAALAAMEKDNATFKVLSFYGKEKDAVELVKAVPGFDLLIAAGGYGEPTYRPQAIEKSKTQMIVVGNKAMYAGLIGLYSNGPFKYARVPLTHEFADAQEMRKIMGQYQDHLKQVGFRELGLDPIPHLSGEKFVGTATCAQCHEDAFDVWSGSMHATATDSIAAPPEDRGDVPRHFDPECISCHVTGWNPQGYSPYASGYESLEASKHLLGNGCENCHGPGESHSKAERDDSGVSDDEKARLRKSMQLPLSRAKEHCMKCHDLDNSPDFHEPDAFEDIYWPEIEH